MKFKRKVSRAKVKKDVTLIKSVLTDQIRTKMFHVFLHMI